MNNGEKKTIQRGYYSSTTRLLDNVDALALDLEILDQPLHPSSAQAIGYLPIAGEHHHTAQRRLQHLMLAVGVELGTRHCLALADLLCKGVSQDSMVGCPMDRFLVIDDNHWYCVDAHVDVLLDFRFHFGYLLVALEHLLGASDSSPLRCGQQECPFTERLVLLVIAAVNLLNHGIFSTLLAGKRDQPLRIKGLAPSATLWGQGEAVGLPGRPQAPTPLLDDGGIDRNATVSLCAQALEVFDLVNTCIVPLWKIRVQLERLEPNLEVSLAFELRNYSLNSALRRPRPVSVRVGDDVNDNLCFRHLLH